MLLKRSLAGERPLYFWVSASAMHHRHTMQKTIRSAGSSRCSDCDKYVLMANTEAPIREATSGPSASTVFSSTF